ncbi:MAG: ABC transporter permease [Actinomycetota bacterium]|nr:ABC transporter permease [Actinomycetota bacterium]
MDTSNPPERAPVADEVSVAVAAEVPVLATTLGAYLRAWAKRVRSGESGVLPVLGGLIILTVIFQAKSSVFLSAGNITNLLIQGSTFMVLGMAEVWVLILGEIDLSVGYVSAIGAVITAIMVGPPHPLPLWVAMPVGILVTAAIGALWGTLVIRLGLPSFVVTLAGLLGGEGVLIWLVNGNGTGGTIRISDNVFLDLTSGNLSPAAGWVVAIATVAVFGGLIFLRDRNRRRSGLVAPPQIVTVAKIVGMAAAGVVLVLVCNTNRGELVPLRGVPYAVIVVIAVVVLMSFVLSRTRFGRYLYAIGGNAEAARRSGVSLGWNRLWAFVLTGATAGIGGMLYAARLGSVSNNVDGGTLVLYAVAAAVIGGASLFGGRGKMVHALLGGIVIATIYNGMGLIGLAADYQYMITALVLLAAVTVDALARRGRTAG